MTRRLDMDHRSKDLIHINTRDKDRSPLRGDMTSNPDTVYARIFVGSLTPDITREVLEDHFSRWGNVLGVTLTKNKFGFVQFEKENEAQACLASGYVTTINGTKLTVKPARMVGQMNLPPPAPGLGSNNIPITGGNWQPTRSGYPSSREAHPVPRDDDYYDSYYRSSSKGREVETVRYGDYYRDYYDRLGGSSSASSYYRTETDSHVSSRGYDATSSSYPLPLEPLEPLDPLDPMRPNDVEIVVPNKTQRAYAESIEVQLKRMGLLVDLLFPTPDISPARVISDLTARRCLYAIFATSENEKHNSLTLNFLHGEPQEHRNMPVEDALRLIERNFEDYVRQTRLRNVRQIVPRDVRNLLLDLLEMRPLSMGDLDKLIKYLRERQNTLVDDQIEQKRETAGTQPSVVATGGMAVTYPGYNYLATTVPGAVTATSQTGHVAAAPPHGILPGAPAPAQVAQPTPVSMVSTSNVNAAAAAAAAIAAYPATAYGGLSAATGLIGAAYGVAPHVAAPQSQVSQPMLHQPPPMTTAPAPPKQSELQERILNIMKSQGGHHPAGITLQSGVVTPTGVPPPTVVPPPRIVSQQPLWMTQHTRPNDVGDKSVQNSQAAYNPWSQ